MLASGSVHTPLRSCTAVMVEAVEDWYGHDLARIRADLSRCRHRDALIQTLVRSAGIEVAGHEVSEDAVQVPLSENDHVI